ncbi:MAG: GNAT family N-acetyltransferase, partial [Hyphomicrobiales bacterium]|nr:GNAT family N-acetyltransferase [Hyphomicrobiales bacterium]
SATDAPHRAFDRGVRAILTRAAQAGDGPSPRHRREWERQERRLAERGAIAFDTLSAPDDVRDSFEDFLAIEAAGWKGEAGTALVAEAGRAAFARAATRLLASRGLARIDRLTVGGRPVAMSVALRAGRRLACWKIAHDPAFAAHSPGAMLVRRMTASLRADASLDFTDGCATADQALLNRLWPERQSMADALVGLRGADGDGFETRARSLARRRGLRDGLKRIAKAAGVRP